jgi:hypothetical protein
MTEIHPLVNDNQLGHLRARGYFVIPGLFTVPEMAAFEVDADRAVDRGKDADDGISKPGRIAFVNSGNYASADPKLLAFSTQPRIANVARAVAGADAAFFSYQLVYKFGNNPDPFPWHQDDSYTRSNNGYFTIWLAISDATISNGCLWVRAGKSLDKIVPSFKTNLGNVCWSMNDPDQGEPVELKRGDAVVFTSFLMHKSGGNSTPQTRKGLIVTFLDHHSTIGGTLFPFLPFPL